MIYGQNNNDERLKVRNNEHTQIHYKVNFTHYSRIGRQKKILCNMHMTITDAINMSVSTCSFIN